MQIRLVINPPHNVNLINTIFVGRDIGGIKYDIRNIPYPPNFNNTAARIIEPATGASTWALGSHKCIKNNGSFTIKARFIINQNEDVGTFNL